MRTHHRSALTLIGAFTVLCTLGHTSAAPFTPGSITVVRVGDGAVALGSAATATFIDEYSLTGSPLQSVAIPPSGAPVLTLSGTATSEGSLVRSPDGARLIFAGYQAPAGTAGVAATTSAVIPREVGSVNASGLFAVNATTGTQFSGSNIRSGATDGMGNFWGGGTSAPAGTGGVNYLGTVAAPAQVLSGNLRWVNVFNGELYFSSGSAAPGAGIHKFTGLPTGGAASTPLTVAANQSPYGFSVNPAGTTMYVADDRAIASGGGIQRWDKAAGVWTLTYTLNSGLGTRGLAVDWSGATPIIYATTTETSNNRLISITDTGVASVPAPISSAGANKAFRSVALSPVRPVKPRFFASDEMPPKKGVYASGLSEQVPYGNGIVVKIVTKRGFSESFPPPPLGTSATHLFDLTTEMDYSTDGGLTFQRVSAPAHATMSVTHTSDGPSASFFDTEMLQLDIAGGTLPGGIMVRESPTKASTGKTTIAPIGGGYMIDSFFDIFTELSIDGGATWSPGQNAVQVELTPDPTIIPRVPAPTNLFPPPNDFFASTQPVFALYPQGIVVREVRHHFFNQSMPVPALGQSQTQEFDSQVDMEVSVDGGQTFQHMRVPAAVTMNLTHVRNEGTTQIFDTEMLQLDLAGGGFPVGVMIRESPTRRSMGGTAIGDPDFDLLRIGSFFDIFTELSVDGGQNWTPATAPSRIELICNAPEIPEPSPNLPPLADQYTGISPVDAAFANGIIIKQTILDQFSQSQPPPPPGGSQVHQTNARARFQMSLDGGQTFHPATAPAQLTFQVSSSVDSAVTRFFDTEMLALDISGGNLPPGTRVRESPTKASLGRTSIRETPTTWRIGSFFDIFVELSVDGGATWSPTTIAPAQLVLTDAPAPPVPHFFTTNNLPSPNGVDAGTQGSFFAAYANGIIVKNMSHKAFSQSLPPPPPGGAQVHNFASTVEADFSIDGGQTFQHMSAPASATMRVTHAGANGATSSFDTEMLALNIAGGGLPAGVMVRESPTRQSTGRTNIEPIGGGYMIDSFFDIFTEISLDGGQNWSPSSIAGHVEGAPDATLIPPVPSPTNLFPPPNDFFASTAPIFVTSPQGVVLRNLKQRFFSQSLPAPALGQTQVHNFSARAQFEMSIDGGQTFSLFDSTSTTAMSVTHSRDQGTTQIFDTEMLQLDLAGGAVMIRESPTRASRGGIAIGDPDFDLLRIGSFFDIFTEVSLDGGQSWVPASGPGRIELICLAPEAPEPSPNLPPPGDEYVSSEPLDTSFAPGVMTRDTKLDLFSQSLPPPPPGSSQVHTLAGRVRVMISPAGGMPFSPFWGEASGQFQVTSLMDQGSTRYFDTEMLALSLHGGNLPGGFMIRESPTKASLGRTSIRQTTTGHRISSFFDIFTELSLDGGQTWQPSTIAPMELSLHDADSDNDGLPDECEQVHFGNLTHGPNEDADGDGTNNLGECIAGTNLTDPTSVLRIDVSVAANNLSLRFPTVVGRKYSIECSPDLGSLLPWQPLVTGILGNGNPLTHPLGPIVPPRRFYRVRVELAP